MLDTKVLRLPRVESRATAPILGLFDCPEWKTWTRAPRLLATRALGFPRLESSKGHITYTMVYTRALRLARVEHND